MIIPVDEQEPYLKPRELYRVKRNTKQIILAAGLGLVAAIYLFLAISPIVTLASSHPAPSQGMVLDHETIERPSSSRIPARDESHTLVRYQGRELCSCNMKYGGAADTVVGEDIDLLITNDGDIVIKDAVEEAKSYYGVWAMVMVGMFIAAMLAFVLSKRAVLRKAKYSDAMALTVMPGKYKPSDWEATFPHLVDIINPTTGNIDYNYIPPQGETPQQKAERFYYTIGEYSIPPAKKRK